jgi:hypothetical protein
LRRRPDTLNRWGGLVDLLGRIPVRGRILFYRNSEYDPELIAKIIDSDNSYYDVNQPPGKRQHPDDSLKPPQVPSGRLPPGKP